MSSTPVEAARERIYKLVREAHEADAEWPRDVCRFFADEILTIPEVAAALSTQEPITTDESVPLTLSDANDRWNKTALGISDRDVPSPRLTSVGSGRAH